MNNPEYPTLTRLSDTDQTVADTRNDIRGRHVVDKDGERIGKVDALLVDDHEHKVRSFELTSGGFLGLGAVKFFIPIDVITSISKDEVHIDRTGKNVADAPSYDPALIQEPRYLVGAYGYYGIAPFWGAGYVPQETPTRPIGE